MSDFVDIKLTLKEIDMITQYQINSNNGTIDEAQSLCIKLYKMLIDVYNRYNMVSYN